ncbi:MAG: hypothetical protein GTO02_18995 [Candidatus Dadabacteria bacterium]|nr:hypothetical protein [Candidatus Dadabacteria bacterium]
MVIDAFDNSASRQLIQDECRRAKIPLLHVGLFGMYGEIVHDEIYRVPKDSEEDICDYPLARNIILLTVTAATEEILDLCLSPKPRKTSWSVTLKDLTIKPLML